MPTARQLWPTLALLLLLALVGLYVHYFTPAEVFWGGYISMMLFYGLIFFIGTYAAGLRKGESNSAEIMLAGRTLPLGIAVFTMSATWVGGGYINGTAEYTANDAYGLLWVQAPWGYALSLVVGGLFFARPMRRHRFKTMLDPLEQRFGKRMAALLFLPALTGEVFWTSAILTALGTTFATVLGLDFDTAIVLSALVAIAYTAIGGLWAVALTDVLQMSILLLGLLIIVPFAAGELGGLPAVWAAYEAKMGSLASPLPDAAALGDYYWSWWDNALLLIFGGIAWQVYFQRVLAAKNESTAVWLSILAALVCLLAALPAVLIGLIGDGVADWTAFGAAGPPESDAIILPYVVRYLTPPFIATLGLGAIAAAVMSSVDSSILSASSMAAWNVYRPLLRPDLSEQKLAKIIQRSIWIIGLAALLMALQVKSVYALWFLCSDLVYCLLFPQLLAALFDKRANVYGALAGFVVALVLRVGGGEALVGLPRFIPYWADAGGTVLFPFRTAAMLSGLLVLMGVSRLTARWAAPRPLSVMAD